MSILICPYCYSENINETHGLSTEDYGFDWWFECANCVKSFGHNDAEELDLPEEEFLVQNFEAGEYILANDDFDVYQFLEQVEIG